MDCRRYYFVINDTYSFLWGMFYRGVKCLFGVLTVITNLVSAVPYVGNNIVVWLWGGYSIDNATLNRFFSFHLCFSVYYYRFGRRSYSFFAWSMDLTIL